jgi:hypothetical protein
VLRGNINLNNQEASNQVIFKRIGSYATDVHFRHIGNTKNCDGNNLMIKNVFQASLMHYEESSRSNQINQLVDKHAATQAARLQLDMSQLILNTSNSQLYSIQKQPTICYFNSANNQF